MAVTYGRRYRCTRCRSENEYVWGEIEYRKAVNPVTKDLPKTVQVPCRRCGETTVQNERGR